MLIQQEETICAISVMRIYRIRVTVFEVENTPIEELNHSIAVYINNSQQWLSVERGENYEVGAQYDGIIENHTGKKIKEWKVAIYLPRKGIIDSSWNGTFAHLVDAKDQYTQEHSIRVALYSEEIARRMGKSEEEVTLIKYIALVHDCGKIGVPDAVLNKKGALNGGEKEIVNSHTVLGGNVLHHFTAIEGIREGALYHHERYDGTGYPKGLAGEEIPLCARIICIADAYDAMSSDRCYRKHLSKEKILEELTSNSGKQFDPDLVRYMIDMIEDGFVYGIHHYDEEDNEINNLGDALV